jgi:3'-phosphoadenosine 5'-phosphosulfate sulfotransferase (PAPS reductase)/FAD synthetase
MMFLKRCGPLYFAKTYKQWRSHPIWNWSEADVWDLLRSNKIAYNPIYDKGAVRCGCMPCTAYKSWKQRLAREKEFGGPQILARVLQMQRQAQLKFDCAGELLV